MNTFHCQSVAAELANPCTQARLASDASAPARRTCEVPPLLTPHGLQHSAQIPTPLYGACKTESVTIALLGSVGSVLLYSNTCTHALIQSSTNSLEPAAYHTSMPPHAASAHCLAALSQQLVTERTHVCACIMMCAKASHPRASHGSDDGLARITAQWAHVRTLHAECGAA